MQRAVLGNDDGWRAHVDRHVQSLQQQQQRYSYQTVLFKLTIVVLMIKPSAGHTATHLFSIDGVLQAGTTHLFSIDGVRTCLVLMACCRLARRTCLVLMAYAPV